MPDVADAVTIDIARRRVAGEVIKRQVVVRDLVRAVVSFDDGDHAGHAVAHSGRLVFVGSCERRPVFGAAVAAAADAWRVVVECVQRHAGRIDEEGPVRGGVDLTLCAHACRCLG
jgi:hypothetical protein